MLVDASFGFEMETFEFLNVLQVHGFPRVMGVLTHLDLLRTSRTQRRTKKSLKQRFWTEIYQVPEERARLKGEERCGKSFYYIPKSCPVPSQGAKLFYLSGLIHGQYPRAEISNLARFVSVMKFHPLDWRSAHPYVVADRMEDLTNPEEVRKEPKCDRTISLYGYVRGTNLLPGSSVHIPGTCEQVALGWGSSGEGVLLPAVQLAINLMCPLIGCGDLMLSNVTLLPDPCPLPEKLKKRSLNEREKLIYAPMAGVGGIVYDKVLVNYGNNWHCDVHALLS